MEESLALSIPGWWMISELAISADVRMRPVISKLCLLMVFVLAGLPLALRGQDAPPPEIITGIRHAVSPPLREIPHLPPEPPQGVIPLRHPQPGGESIGNDLAVQSATTTATSSNTTAGLNFDGITADGYIPPDTNLSVGATQIVQIVNVEYAVYDKLTSTRLTVPAAIHTIFTALGAPCGTADGGDPVVLYDKMAGRWLVSQLEFPSSRSNYVCIAVSTTSDATGSYNLYEVPFNQYLPDYPKFGVWPDAYYFSANMFRNGSSFTGAKACAFPRSAMLAGQTSIQGICFQQSSSVASLLPSDLDGSTQPSSGEPNFYVNFVTNGLNLYRFHVDFATPSNSTFTGPVSVSNVAPFSQACGGGTCIPQPGTTQQLDSLGDRLMFRLAYRNFGSYESLVVNHSVQISGSSNQTGIRWYEIRNPTGTPSVYQQSTYAPDTSTYRWMGSIAEDQSGDLAVGYSVSNSSNIYPGIRYAGRVPSDTPGTLEAESGIVNGAASQTGSYSYRWGDYSSMSIDPSDDCTFWYTTEYIVAGGSFNWNTRIASFKFSTCGQNLIATTTALTSATNPSTYGQSVTFTAMVSPSAATGTVQFLDGSSSLGMTTLSGGTAQLSTSSLQPEGQGSSWATCVTSAQGSHKAASTRC